MRVRRTGIKFHSRSTVICRQRPGLWSAFKTCLLPANAASVLLAALPRPLELEQPAPSAPSSHGAMHLAQEKLPMQGTHAAIFRSSVFLNRGPVARHALRTPTPALGW
eukprot:scaffold1676_cov92-Phaeocystis_antarctica.AAC.2